ncbi:MAG: tRNA dihydrouridine synthase DusB [Ruminococcus sp.]|nr:tRNA dihydrouridine synthase DusB [Ruminococcus sp.]MBR1750056.1 tRNA dihydrouridine synthase DusB [Ruminococcus sp.]
MEHISIGSIKTEKTAALAPMASVADAAYRIMCKRFGAAYLVSEMISSKGLVYGDKKTGKLCTILDEERPCALQLFGEEPEFMGKAAALLAPYSPDIIDINMGCPVPKIVSNGSGSALMKDPVRAAEIIAATAENARCPVTVKIRSGWDNNSINAVEFAVMCEKAGAAAITVHARTKQQMYSGQADRDIIRQVKEAVSVPVIGNGDVKTPQDCKAMYESTGCDLVMIGRGSYGRPWIFEQIRKYFETGELTDEPTPREKAEIMLSHGELLCSLKGEEQGIREMRKNVAWYVKGLPDAAKIRGSTDKLFTLKDLEAVAEIMGS